MNLLGPPSETETPDHTVKEKIVSKHPKVVYREAGYNAHNYEPLLRSNNSSQSRKGRFEHQDSSAHTKQYVSVRAQVKNKDMIDKEVSRSRRLVVK